MIVNFTTEALPEIRQVGGKAWSLMRMSQAKLAVPPGFALAVAFFDAWIDALQATKAWEAVQAALRDESRLEAATGQLKKACEDLRFTDDQQAQVDEALRALPDDALFAVRSSSPEEDIAGASFAGGYETILGATRQTLEAAVREAFASAFDERVFVYKRQHGFAVKQPRIAVIVQQQIASDIAGVGFSLNPINNDYDEAVIDANFGLGESVVSGLVSPDHFVVDKHDNENISRRLGGKETAIWLQADGGTREQQAENTGEFCLDDARLREVVKALIQIEKLYAQPTDIEWAVADDTLYLLQARPITAYVPLADAMLTAPDEQRRLYWDPSLTEGVTINEPMTVLTIDYFFVGIAALAEPILGPIDLPPYVSPQTNLVFASGGRFYINLSQTLHVISRKQLVKSAELGDALLTDLMANLDVDKYKARHKFPMLRWPVLICFAARSLWHARRMIRQTMAALWKPERFQRYYEKVLTDTVTELKSGGDPDLSLREAAARDQTLLRDVFREVGYAAVVPYVYYGSRLDGLAKGASDTVSEHIDAMKMGFGGNEAVDIGVRLYRLTHLLKRTDFDDMDALVRQIEQRDMSDTFLAEWDEFIDRYGHRAPGELELANPRYGESPALALEQMSYMVGSDFDPQAQQQQRIDDRRAAFEALQAQFSGHKLRRLRRAYEIMDLTGGSRDMPKYLLVLANGRFRQRALRQGEAFAHAGRLDAAEDIFWFTMAEIDTAADDASMDLRGIIEQRKPFYEQLESVRAFPQLIDSRGRIPQVDKEQDDPNVFQGLGVSRGSATGRVKVLHSPREKPVEEGDVLVAYTTDPGWTPLFVNAAAIVLEIGGMLQHGGVVAREYGKPCVAGIQGITTRLRDGQRVEVDGISGVVRILD